MNLRLLALCLVLSACSDEASRPTPPECHERLVAVAAAEADVERLTTEARQALGEEANALAWSEVELARLKLYRARASARGCP
jgi:hypothetical protein